MDYGLYSTYWNHWRKACHSSRQLYHREMEQFYQSQINAQEQWTKVFVELYNTLSSTWLNSIMLASSYWSQPSKMMGMFGK